MYIHIQSKDNAQLKQLRLLTTSNKHRKNSGCSVIEGVHLLDSLLTKTQLLTGEPQQHNLPSIQQLWIAHSAQSHSEVEDICQRIADIAPRIRVYVLDDHLYRQISTLGTGVDVLAVITMPSNTTDVASINTDTLILNDVQDIGNVGTLLRTAAAVGIKNIVCTPLTANIWSPKCLRAGMGAHFSLNIFEKVSTEQITQTFAQTDVQLMATSSHTDNTIYNTNLTQPVAWIMGNEGQGVCDELMNLATPITIPQPNGEESLNVAIAGALCMYEMLRQRDYS